MSDPNCGTSSNPATCTFHLCQGIRRMMETEQQLEALHLDSGAARPPIEEFAGLHLGSGRQSGLPVATIRPSFDGFGPSQHQTQDAPRYGPYRRGTTRTGPYRGAPFIPHPEYHLPTGDLRLNARIVVESDNENRAYRVERLVVGAHESRNVHLLRCEQASLEDCNVFGYMYQGILYTYGFHNHM